jgi:hypothetical protein
MELIPYSQFAKLRLKQFVESDVEVTEGDGWEWMGGLWFGEGISSSTYFARLKDTPDETGGLEIDFTELPESSAQSILDTINLPLKSGMTFDEVRSALGVPEKTTSLAGWKNNDFTLGEKHPYFVSATVDHAKGLTNLTVIRKDVLSRIEAESDAAFLAQEAEAAAMDSAIQAEVEAKWGEK